MILVRIYILNGATGKEYCILALMTIGRTIMSFLSPIGINRLLAYVFSLASLVIQNLSRPYSYIENGGQDALVRPWVWVSFLFLSPFLMSLLLQMYIFVTVIHFVQRQSPRTDQTTDSITRPRSELYDPTHL